MDNLLLHFPENYTPTKAQKSILTAIGKSIGNNNKFIIVNAPTGTGKSFIPKTLANFVEGPSETFSECVDDYSIFDNPSLVNDEKSFGVYALTITKALQDQYKNTFDDTGILKGKSNYQCGIDDSLSVDIASCIYLKGLKQKCWEGNKCSYYNERNKMLKSKFSSLSYSMFFSLPNHLKKRKIIVCDEGSELEDQLVSQFECPIDLKFLVRNEIDVAPFPSKETSSSVMNWLINLMGLITKKVENLKTNMSSSVIKSSSDYAVYSKMLSLENKMKTLIDTYYDCEYLIDKVDRSIKFVPLKVDKLAKTIFEYADHVVIMSATIIDHKNYAKNLGITNYDYIESESDFDENKAPIYILAKQKLNFKNLNEMLPKLARQVDGILEEHSNDKGIIHTHTHTIATYIAENVHNDRLLCRTTEYNNEKILEAHERSDAPTVLVSPSMTYGVDLKGDLAKFQIVLKAPWMPSKNIRVEKMMKIDNDWYTNRMLCTLVQACGRGVRSETDECITYILDGTIYDVIKRNQHKLPKYFIKRIQ